MKGFHQILLTTKLAKELDKEEIICKTLPIIKALTNKLENIRRVLKDKGEKN